MHRMAQCQSTITCRNSNDSVSALTPCDKYDRKKIKCETDMTAHISAGFHKIQSEHEFHIFVWLLFFLFCCCFLDIEHLICSYFAFSLFVSSLTYHSWLYILDKSSHPYLCNSDTGEEDQGIQVLIRETRRDFQQWNI